MPLMAKTLAERFADYAIGLRFEDLPKEVVHEARRLVAAGGAMLLQRVVE